MTSSLKDENSLFKFVVKDGNGVKGLVDAGLTEVPQRYIQPPYHRIDKQQTVAAAPEMIIPIDLSELDGPNHDHVVNAIVHAAETLGFFQVVNHGVPLELLESLKSAAHKFFGQPVKTKAAYLEGVSPSPMVSYGTSFVPEKEESLQWRDYVKMGYTNDADALKFWPNECKDVGLEYIKTSREMVKRLLQILIGNLGAKLDDLRLDTLIGLKKFHINLYPPCPNPELTIGAKRHSDMGMLTLLLQDDIGGLYMKIGENSSTGNEEWIEVPPLHGALVLNVGDALQMLSNGRYISVEHQVGTTRTASRVSVAIFNNPLPMAKIGPFSEVVASDGVARYRELTFEEYRNNLYEKDNYEGKRALEFAYI